MLSFSSRRQSTSEVSKPLQESSQTPLLLLRELNISTMRLQSVLPVCTLLLPLPTLVYAGVVPSHSDEAREERQTAQWKVTFYLAYDFSAGTNAGLAFSGFDNVGCTGVFNGASYAAYEATASGGCTICIYGTSGCNAEFYGSTNNDGSRS